jgi:hypothetical protein
MKILLRIGLFIFLTVAQFSLYRILTATGYTAWSGMGHDIRPDLNWGITVWVSLYVFGILSTISALFHSFRWKHRWPLALVLFVVFCLFFFYNGYRYHPYRATLLLLSGLIGLSAPPAILEIVRRLRRKPNGPETLLDSGKDL